VAGCSGPNTEVEALVKSPGGGWAWRATMNTPGSGEEPRWWMGPNGMRRTTTNTPGSAEEPGAPVVALPFSFALALSPLL
jgi:hypothetical protein